jgi:hypothetical protein
MSQYIRMEYSSYSQLVENQDRVYLFILHSKSLLVCLLIIYDYDLLTTASLKAIAFSGMIFDFHFFSPRRQITKPKIDFFFFSRFR